MISQSNSPFSLHSKEHSGAHVLISVIAILKKYFPSLCDICFINFYKFPENVECNILLTGNFVDKFSLLLHMLILLHFAFDAEIDEKNHEDG